MLGAGQSAIGMAFEAVDLDAGVGMATGTKVLRILVTDDFVTGVRRVMAIHAADQAVFRFPLAFDYRRVALMHQEFHVITTHYLDRFDTLAGVGRFYRGRNHDLAEARCVFIRGARAGKGQGAEQAGKHQEAQH